MKKYRLFITLLIIYLIVIGFGHCNDLEQGLVEGKAAYEAIQGSNFGATLNATVGTEEIQNLLSQSPDEQLPLDPSAVPNKTALDLIRESSYLSAKQIKTQLLQQSHFLDQQHAAIENQGIQASILSPEQAAKQVLSPNQIVNQNALTMETFPNTRNPATEAAFEIVESTDKSAGSSFGQAALSLSMQEQYQDVPQVQTTSESYEMGCSSSLLGSDFECTKTLEIRTEEQPDAPFSKTISSSFDAQTYQTSSFNINFKTGVWTQAYSADAHHCNLSDTLGADFGPGTTVKLISRSDYKADNGCVDQKITQSPSYDNGFVLGFQSHQNNTKHKNNRNKARGSTIAYQFSTIKAQPPRIVSEQWQNPCTDLEDLRRLAECTLVSETCLEGQESKAFGSKEPYLRVNRPCWKKKLKFSCKVPQGANDCDQIPRDCLKTGSEFIDFLGQHAVEVHQFRCQRTVSEHIENHSSVGSRIGVAGEYQGNLDIGEAIAALNIAKEIAAGFRAQTASIQGLFFSGQALECTSKPKQCCADSKSFWRKLTGCRESEQQLAEAISKGLCHEVGSYRVKNSLLQKIGHVDKKGYCCFQSKLSRIVQEGARAQLPNANWGTGESPNCRALTIPEIQSLNWSLIDFSELAKDFIEKAKNTPISQSVQLMLQNQLRASLSLEAANLSASYPNTPLGRAQEAERQSQAQKIKEAETVRRVHGARSSLGAAP